MVKNVGLTNWELLRQFIKHKSGSWPLWSLVASVVMSPSSKPCQSWFELQCCMFCVWLQQIIVTNYYGGEHLPWLKLKWHFFRSNWLVFCVVLRQSTYLFRPSGINTAKYFLTTNIYLLGCSPPRDFSLAENLMNSFWCI